MNRVGGGVERRPELCDHLVLDLPRSLSRAFRSLRNEGEVVMSSIVETATEIRPFHVEIPEEELDDLRRRLAATRWASRVLVADRRAGNSKGPICRLCSEAL
jgi:hypothetical protein